MSAELLRRAARHLRLSAEDIAYRTLMDAPIALALADWLEDVADSTPANTDDWPSVVVARAILREPS